MPAADATSAPRGTASKVLEVVRHYWGFDSLRPLQQEAIDAALAGRDTLVVLPTGGGKSLCYQVPPAVSGGTDVVVSPLISLMKDQVDGLRECGYPAAALYTGIEGHRRREIELALAEGELRLLFVAPERVSTPWFAELAQRIHIRRIAIDEAHCISHWGHDFRPDYRQLAHLRQWIPKASFHAFTATATPRVREDIAKQLGLRDPAIMVGSFDRPNLIYRVIPQEDVYRQTIDVVRRHAGEAVIIYCISRKDTENVAAMLKANGIEAEAYHAGLDAAERHRVQDAFADERLNVVVATVAFGMGIDRSNVRCVLHVAMPKTIEHYQQESGRAGRDGLEAECVVLYSYGDQMRWEGLIRKSAENAEKPDEVIDAQLHLLKQMQQLCNRPYCRHRALVEYFGQTYPRDKCDACDVCLGDAEGVEDGTVAAQKILSCVARLKESFGVGHVVDVLTGSDTETIRRLQHQSLSTYGILRDLTKKQIQSMVFQLVDQGLLERTAGDRPVLKLNDLSWEVLRNEREVKLLRAKKDSPAKGKVDAQSWEGVDRELFDHLRKWRLDIAHQRGLPPYLVLDDASLRSLARIRPSRGESLRRVRGMGDKRLADFGDTLLECVRSFCAEHGLSTDQVEEAKEAEIVKPAKGKQPNAAKMRAFEMFRKGRPIEEVQQAIGRVRSTTVGYLSEYIAEEKPPRITYWVADATYRQIAEVAANREDRRLTPIFEKLDGKIPYDTIRLVLSHLEASQTTSA